jgi:3-hydroxyacyl-[acyl-carrier-protein] dehydratase
MNRSAEKSGVELALGPDVVRHLLPHRRPLLFVDAIRRYDPGAESDRPSMWAYKNISASEEVFTGHYPGLHLWPGVYTIEGLGQSTFLLEVIFAMQAEWTEKGGDPAEVLAALRNLELGYRLDPRFRPEASAMLKSFGGLQGRIGISASLEMRFLHPVFAGQRLDYHVVRTHAVERQAASSTGPGKLVRFEVEAWVDDRAVARGVMTGAIGVGLSEALLPPD